MCHKTQTSETNIYFTIIAMVPYQGNHINMEFYIFDFQIVANVGIRASAPLHARAGHIGF